MGKRHPGTLRLELKLKCETELVTEDKACYSDIPELLLPLGGSQPTTTLA